MGRLKSILEKIFFTKEDIIDEEGKVKSFKTGIKYQFLILVWIMLFALMFQLLLPNSIARKVYSLLIFLVIFRIIIYCIYYIPAYLLLQRKYVYSVKEKKNISFKLEKKITRIKMMAILVNIMFIIISILIAKGYLN